jgi:hypothetical protein
MKTNEEIHELIKEYNNLGFDLIKDVRNEFGDNDYGK